MIRKEYHVAATKNDSRVDSENDSQIKDEILNVLNIAFGTGAIVELKILEGVDLSNDGKRFSKIRMDIVSNTDFDKYEL